MSFPDGEPQSSQGITFVNWRTHPWQMWSMLSLIVWSVGILADETARFHPAPMTDINNPKVVNLVASAMLVAATISLIGLHMKDREFGVWAEASGYIALTAAMISYFVSAVHYLGFESSWSRLGTATSLGYVAAMSYRTVQIIQYQRARWKVHRLEDRIAAEAEKIGDDTVGG